MNPSLYQVNVRAWLFQLSSRAQRPCQLDDIPDTELDQLSADGFDWLWLLGIWQTGAEGERIAQQIPELRDSYRRALPDLQEEDITGSTFAVQAYSVHQDFGGNQALGRFRERLRARGIRLLLDFVPNHTALDHPWVTEHPEYYVAGTGAALDQQPGNYISVNTCLGARIIAHGRDPYFPGWTDTAQLNYGNPELQLAMRKVLQQIAHLCDGVRCDMAMLVLPEVFLKTWGIEASPFWPAAVDSARAINPDFCFIAEVYWGLEGALQQQGFDYTYDKTLYDQLAHRDTARVRKTLRADLRFQQKQVRFLENHDEPRAAEIFPWPVQAAAAVIAYFTPGLRFFHSGQLDGATIKPSIQLRRRYPEPLNPVVHAFYVDLLRCFREGINQGEWIYLETSAAWDGNWTSECFVSFAWREGTQLSTLIAVNFSDHQSQCYLQLPFPELDGQQIVLEDQLGPAVYRRSGTESLQRGLYLDLAAWRYHVFSVSWPTSSSDR